jgi:hypothetical protein
MKIILNLMGYWILITFVLLYLIMLATKSKNVTGAYALAVILSTGIVLAFLI